MKVLITGATGMVGKTLCLDLIKNSYQIKVLTRSVAKAKKELPIPVELFEWADTSQLPPREAFADISIVINLAGENLLSKRWSEEQKKRIYDSRIIGTKNLVAGLNAYANLPLEAMVSISGFNVYKQQNGKINERSPLGDDFLAKVCKDWEAEAQNFQGAKRSIIFRTPMVLSHDCEFVNKAFLLADFGLATYFGDGTQMTPWIHVKDLCSAIKNAMEDIKYDGIINAVAPESIKSKDMAKKISRLKYKRGLTFPTPAVAIKAILGEAALLPLCSYDVSSEKLAHLGMNYQFANIDDCLKDIFNIFYDSIKNRTVLSYRFTQIQHIEKPVDEAYEFFCDPHNLEEITPELLNFKIKEMSDGGLKEGARITYRLKLHGFPMKWKTIITKWNKGKTFTDYQKSGPYTLWNHRHDFTEIKNGTIMEDEVLMRGPLKQLGWIVFPFVLKDVKTIFQYRRDTIDKLMD